MVERRQHLRFAFKAGHALGVLSKGFRQDFQRDVAAQLGIARR